jgi:outer membrane protein OmpA-like peptidoglycan-associated protein
MKKQNYIKVIILTLLVGHVTIVLGQKTKTNQAQKESASDYLNKMKAMADSIKNARKDYKSNGKNTNTNSNLPPRISNSMSDTKKSTIENAYKYLSAAEKEKVKNYPPVPEAFRTNIDAEIFLNSLKGVDVNGDVQKFSKEKSVPLTGYCISYYSTKQKAEQIVKEAKKLETEFNKNNPAINFGKAIGKTYVSENGLVYLPLGDASFVDEVVDAKYISGDIQFPKENCIGTPDYILMNDLKKIKGIYSLGLNGTLTIKFANNALVDVNGPDLFVFEAGEIEPTNLDISKDGINWINVGKVSGGTASVDISKVAKPTDYFYYVRLTDLNTASTVAGADIDAVAAIGAAIKLSLNAEVLFDLGKANLKADGIAAIKKLAQQLQTMPNAQLNIDGFTDDKGTDEANFKLSLQRAQAVAAILKEELKSKIGFVYKETGKGKANPVVPNNSEENRKKNRRVEILVMPK